MRKGGTTKRTTDGSPRESVSRAESRLADAAVGLVFLGCITFIAVVAADQLQSSDRYTVQLADIAPPVPDDSVAASAIRASFEDSTLDGMRMSIFDSDLVRIVRQGFESNPWVAKVESVRRVFPGRVTVDLEYREPWLCAVRDGRYVAVARDGSILPLITDEPVVDPPYIVVAKPGEALDSEGFSERWFHDAVHEATAVARELTEHVGSPVFDHIGLEAIDVSNFRGRLDARWPEVVLVTDRTWNDEAGGVVEAPLTIHWGRSSVHARGLLELPVSTKLRHLEDVLRTRPALAGIRQVDVRFDQAFWR